MPLVKSSSKKAFSENVRRERNAGKPIKQSLAIAYSVKRKAEHKGALAMKKHHSHHHHMKEAHKHMKDAHHSHKKAMHHMERAKEMKMEPKVTNISKLDRGAGGRKLHHSGHKK